MRQQRAGRLAVLGMLLLSAGIALLGTSTLRADEGGWVDFSSLDAWKGAKSGWETVSDVSLKEGDARRIVAKPGAGVIYNGPTGRAGNLISKESFGDVELHLEFNVPKNSNSGVKLEEVYEIQIFDSYGVTKLTASHCGGVYPRAELLPRYHHIDKGYPPLANACKPPGEWQTLDIQFRTPKFDAQGKKTSNAKFVLVKLNGQVVQENLEVPYPTGNNWRNPEHSTGALFLQGDHGAVAFRNIRARKLP